MTSVITQWAVQRHNVCPGQQQGHGQVRRIGSDNQGITHGNPVRGRGVEVNIVGAHTEAP